jgi:N-acetylmuramoyl-L-alanine amidase
MLILDPGHGGTDPGAVFEDVKEYLINQKISHRLGALAQYFMETIQTNEYTDTQETSLEVRAAFAKSKFLDKFISIHSNSFSDPLVSGLEVFYHPGSEEGREMALRAYNSILKFSEIAGYTYKTRGVKARELAVLKLTPCPAILIECGFISNPIERAWLRSEKGQIVIASAIAFSLLPNINGFTF